MKPGHSCVIIRKKISRVSKSLLNMERKILLDGTRVGNDGNQAQKTFQRIGRM